MREKRPRVAAHFISRAITLFPGDAKSHYIHATILEQLGEIERARQAAARAATLDPRQPEFTRLLRRLRDNGGHQPRPPRPEPHPPADSMRGRK